MAVHAQTVYKTRTGAKYHVATCGYLKSSFAINIQAALAEGLTACSVCKPGNGPATPQPTVTPINNLVPAAATSGETRGESVQCAGTTKAGARCRRLTRAASGRCYQH
ncbi:hypothetical protein AAE02nite_43490 [Adhaeribacter aerolatus]|uniref:Ada DNA repair metal-binding domain-containing protein n=1 Tax=Adhaeribacter aerolatus TaxID=670289 RepID=A0A512B3Z6_9BACT|nr:hypothetical protein AAE02nite_43490 [Adhaeribacter aerolatus]